MSLSNSNTDGTIHLERDLTGRPGWRGRLGAVVVMWLSLVLSSIPAFAHTETDGKFGDSCSSEGHSSHGSAYTSGFTSPLGKCHYVRVCITVRAPAGWYDSGCERSEHGWADLNAWDVVAGGSIVRSRHYSYYGSWSTLDHSYTIWH